LVVTEGSDGGLPWKESPERADKMRVKLLNAISLSE